MSTAGTDAIVLLNGRDISTYLRSASTNGMRDMLDSTHLGLNDRAFTPGLRNATFNGEGFFDGSADAIDEILAELLDDVSDLGAILTYLPYGDGFGNRGKGIDGDLATYDITSPVDGLVTTTLSVQSSVGNEPIQVLHISEEEYEAGNGTALDGSAATTNGGSAYLQATDAADANLVVRIEGSANGSTGWATVGTFAAQDANGAQRIELSASLPRYLRAVWDAPDYPATFNVAVYRQP